MANGTITKAILCACALCAIFLSTMAFAEDHISEAQVKVAIEEWVAAQNTRDFRTYKNLYAAKFYGIRRSGSHTSSFNRDSWLKDRARMFRKDMKVEISMPKITVSGTTASVRFKQRWESGSYKDVGDKVMAMTLEGTTVRIVREEMLSSDISGKWEGRGDGSGLEFAFVIKEGIVIADDNIDFGRITEKPKLESKGPVFVSSVSLDTTLFPKATRSLLGMTVRLYSITGSCETTIKGFKIVSKEVPHQSQIETWRNQRVTEDKIAEAVYMSGNHHLIATTGSCSGDFAKDTSLPAVRIYTGRPADAVTKKSTKIALSGLPMYTKHIKPYEHQLEEEHIRIFSFESNGKTSTWVSAYLSAGNRCGEGGAIGALWEVIEDRSGKVFKWIKYLPEDPIYATDLDNDGNPEFYYRPNNTSYTGFISGKITGNPSKRGKASDDGNKFLEETALHDDSC